MLKTKDVSMTKLFQQKLFAKSVNNSGTPEAAFLVNRTFSFFKGTCLYCGFSSYFAFYLCSFMVVSYLDFLLHVKFTVQFQSLKQC